MTIFDTIPFAKELLSPTYAESFRRAGATAGPNDVALDAGWALAAEGDDPVVRTAADHLAAFVTQSVGGALGSAGKPVRLRVDPAAGESPEAHVLRVGPDAVEVAGAGPAGVLQGVFRLEALMKERGGPFLPVGEERRAPLFRHRIHRSFLSPFYVEEMTGYDGPPLDARWLSPGMAYPGYAEEDAGPDMFYHDNLLMRLAQHGFNGVWVRGALSLFAKTKPFPEFGRDSERILTNLRGLCERAARWGISVFLYMQEPMGMRAEDPFWQAHPNVLGSPSPYKPMMHLCTSTPEVKEYLREGTRAVFEKVPNLAGVMLITASEFPSHCYSHLRRPADPDELAKEVAAGKLCPRCAPRTPQQVIGEIVTLILEGARAAQPKAEVISWNWSWAHYEPDPQSGVMECLPPDAIVMGDYERGEPAEACGFPYTNDEYSIKVVGPSQRFRGVAAYQKERGRPVYAKIQIGTTHENPNIPYLPVPQKIARKYQTLAETGVSGMMTCWNFGNMPSLGTEVAGEFSFGPQPCCPNSGLRRIALRHFGPAAAEDVVKAWEILTQAHEDFPSSIPVMYNGPISRAQVMPLPFDKIDHKFPNSWLLDKEVEGDLLTWATPFGPEKVLECYRSEVAKSAGALALFDQALAKTEGDDRRRLAREAGVARFHIAQTVSSANLVDFILTRNAFLEATDAGEKSALLDKMEAICLDETGNLRASIPLLEADGRLGWHGEAYGYMIAPDLVRTKLAGIEEILGRRIPAERAKLGGR